MKVMVAYDGSAYADAALDDLSRAGIPVGSEILLMTVVDLSVSGPSVSEFDLVSAASGRLDRMIEQARGHRERVLDETRDATSQIAHRLGHHFPGWAISSEVLLGDPAAELLRRAEQWNADLIMGGSQGRSAIGRFFLGSVSKTAAENATSSVRVVRARPGGAQGGTPKIILGAKDTESAMVLVNAIGKREWPDGTEVRLVSIDDGISPGRVSAVYPYARSIYESIIEPLAKVGLQASVQVESGNPHSILLESAESFESDAIFLVPGVPHGERGLDSTASVLVTTANCSVEIVR